MNLPPAVPKPCNECPWRRAALRGWLGPHSASEWVGIAHSDQPIACHKTIRPTDPIDQLTGIEPWEVEGLRQCAGAAIFRSNVSKSSRFAQDAGHDFKPDTEIVFARDQEFIDHHERRD